MAGKAFRAAEKHVEKYPSAGTGGTRRAPEEKRSCGKRSVCGATYGEGAHATNVFCGGPGSGESDTKQNMLQRMRQTGHADFCEKR